MDKMNVLVIINPKSGTGSKESIPALIAETLDDSRYSITTRVVQAEGDAERFARQAVEDGAKLVIAVGGDGTVNGAACGLRHTGVPLAIIPCGSGNGLARHIGISLNVKKALKTVTDFHVEDFDYCTVNDTPFFCTCGMGFDAWVAHEFAQAGSRGLVTYVKKTLSEYIKYKPREYTIEIDGHTLTERAFVIACANAAQYGNNAFIAPHASMQDGMIDITIIHPFNPLASPVLGALLFAKQIHKDLYVKTLRTTHLTIHRPYAEVMHLDGEPMEMPADLDIRIHPAGLKIVIPNNPKHKI